MATNVAQTQPLSNRRANSSSVLVLYTGGTIGMIPDVDNGNVLKPSATYIRQELSQISAQQDPEFPRVEVAEFDEVIDSSDMAAEEWAKIAQLVEREYFSYDGFVIIMGTDTMAYAASALSFMLKNLGKPVIFTGSMIPLYKGYSDARRNLLLSIQIAGTTSIPEVCIFFHDKLLRGNRTKKVSSNSLEAFQSPNMAPLAVCGTTLNVNESLVMKPPRQKLVVRSSMSLSVLVIRLIPGFSDIALEQLILNREGKPMIKALVLELYGVGNAPLKKRSLLTVLQRLIEKDLVIAICSQCLQGEVNLLTYEVGKSLYEIGCLSTLDMTVEAVATKLSFLFGQDKTIPEVKSLLITPLRGELTLNSPSFSKL